MSFNSRALEGQDIPKTGRDDDDEDEIGKVDLPGESGGDDQADARGPRTIRGCQRGS